MVGLPLPQLSARRARGRAGSPTADGRHPVVQRWSVEVSSERWPKAAEALRDELARRPGRLALLCGDGVERVAHLIATAIDVSQVRVGLELTQGGVPGPDAVRAALGDSTILVDCEILFDPELGIDPLQLLRTLARRAPRIATWPGRIDGGRAIYSESGRRDHYDRQLTDALVLHPRVTVFPDEVPYTIERIP